MHIDHCTDREARYNAGDADPALLAAELLEESHSEIAEWTQGLGKPAKSCRSRARSEIPDQTTSFVPARILYKSTPLSTPRIMRAVCC